MNCSQSQWLQTLLSRLLLELHHQGNASGLGAGPGPSMGREVLPDPFVSRQVTSSKGAAAYLYILLITIFYTCLAGGLILAYSRSRKLVQAKDDPAQARTELPWATGGTPAAADTATSSPTEGSHQLIPAGLPALSQGTEGV